MMASGSRWFALVLIPILVLGVTSCRQTSDNRGGAPARNALEAQDPDAARSSDQAIVSPRPSESDAAPSVSEQVPGVEPTPKLTEETLRQAFQQHWASIARGGGVEGLSAEVGAPFFSGITQSKLWLFDKSRHEGCSRINLFRTPSDDVAFSSEVTNAPECKKVKRTSVQVKTVLSGAKELRYDDAVARFTQALGKADSEGQVPMVVWSYLDDSQACARLLLTDSLSMFPDGPVFRPEFASLQTVIWGAPCTPARPSVSEHAAAPVLVPAPKLTEKALRASKALKELGPGLEALSAEVGAPFFSGTTQAKRWLYDKSPNHQDACKQVNLFRTPSGGVAFSFMGVSTPPCIKIKRTAAQVDAVLGEVSKLRYDDAVARFTQALGKPDAEGEVPIAAWSYLDHSQVCALLLLTSTHTLIETELRWPTVPTQQHFSRASTVIWGAPCSPTK